MTSGFLESLEQGSDFNMEIDNIELYKMREHVMESYPKEACGIVADDLYHPVKNTHRQPEQNFKIAPKVYLEFADRIQAVIHSHCVGLEPIRFGQWEIDPRTPSQLDMVSQQEMGVPFGIVACEGENVSKLIWFGEKPPAPILGRPFIHGIYDCYSLIRDWYYLEMGIELPEHPRQLGWWRDRENIRKALDMYEDGWRKDGWTEINLHGDLEVGDVLLMKYESKRVNHGGLYIGNGKFIHQAIGCQSRDELVREWKPLMVRAVRYVT